MSSKLSNQLHPLKFDGILGEQGVAFLREVFRDLVFMHLVCDLWNLHLFPDNALHFIMKSLSMF